MVSTVKEQSDRVDTALQRYRLEIHIVASSYYLWKSIRNKIASDRKVYNAYNLTPTFWTTTLHSLQVTQFVAIGRIFDTNRSAFSIRRLRQICEKNIEAFSHEGLTHRRGWDDLEDDEFDADLSDQVVKGLWIGEGPGWKKRYIEKSYEITLHDIDRIFFSLNVSESNYKKGAKIARDNVFAHSNPQTDDASTYSFEGVMIREFERALDDLHTVYFLLNGNISNGHAPHLIPRKYVPDGVIEESVNTVTEKLLYKQP